MVLATLGIQSGSRVIANHDHERTILATICSKPEVVEEWLFREDDFDNALHQKVYQRMIAMIREREVIDGPAVRRYFSTEDGLSFLDDGYMPWWKSLAGEIRELGIRRRILSMTRRVAEEVRETTAEVLVSKIERELTEIQAGRKEDGRLVKDIVPLAFGNIAERFASGGMLGMATGFPRLDNAIDGVHDGEVIIIGARPGTGKTAMLCNISMAMAKRGRRVVIFSAEMSGDKLVQRMMSYVANLDHDKFRRPLGMTPSQMEDLESAGGVVAELPIWIDDTAGIGVDYLESRMRRYARQEHIEVAFVDYLGLVGHPDFHMRRFEQVADISKRLKNLARELSIPLVVLSQLTRDTEGREPTLASLRDSGAVEQDADMVWFLHGDMSEPDLQKIPVTLIVAKNRNGPVGKFEFIFNRKTVSFYEVDHGR